MKFDGSQVNQNKNTLVEEIYDEKTERGAKVPPQM